MREDILNQLKTAWAGKPCLCFDSLESTNDYAKELAKTERVHGTLIVAETQTAGKGRRGRIWKTPPESAIAMSLCLEPKIRTEKTAGLTLVMALAVAEAIREVTGEAPEIKWPNDVVMNGKKICGILTEMYLNGTDCVVVIGTGINVNMTEFPSELAKIATSLRLEKGKEFSREAIVASAMKYFEIFYQQYEQTQNMSLLRSRYEKMLANKDKEVYVLDPREPYQGIAKGINEDGNLIVVCEDGTERNVGSGEVSVRGIYGYV